MFIVFLECKIKGLSRKKNGSSKKLPFNEMKFAKKNLSFFKTFFTEIIFFVPSFSDIK